MLEKIDHIGIAVNSLEEAMKFYKSIGLQVGHIEEVASQRVKVAMFDIGGVHIELLEPTSEDSPIAKFLEKNREGMHHIAYRVKDIGKVLLKLESEGVALIDKEPKMGANNMLVAFVHPKSVSGVLTELSEPAS